VEGAAPLVLAGEQNKQLKRVVVRYLMAEVNGPRLVENGSSPAQLVEQLGSLGFVPARLTRRCVAPVQASKWDLDPAREYDRLFVHEAAG